LRWETPKHLNILTIILFVTSLGLAVAGQSVSTNLAQPTAALRQRAYPVDPDSLFRHMRQAIGEKEIQTDAAVLRTYLKQKQIDLSPPSSVKFDPETKSVVVNSTAENLAKVEVLFPAPPAQPVLFIETHRFSSNDVFTRMRHSMGGGEGQPDFEVLGNFLKNKGVELAPPFSWFYKPLEKWLIVRATKENHEAIDKLVAEINSSK